MLEDWRVVTNRAVFWVQTNNGLVTDAAPIAKRHIGNTLDNLLRAFDYRHGGIECQPLRYRRSGGVMPRGFRLIPRGEGDLKTRYRPQTMKEAVPTFPIRRVNKILKDPNASQVYLFEGISGTGKTSAARIIARAAVCEDEKNKPCLECSACKALEQSMDFVEINVANFRKIDDIRDIIEGMRYMPAELPRKIYIFDEVHQLTPDSQQLLLKVLEEPAKELLFFLCTTEKGGLKRTLISRAQSISFKRVSKKHAERVITQVFEDHEKEPPSQELVDDMFGRADGSVRDLLNLIQAYLEDDYEIGAVDDGMDAPPDIVELVKALRSRNWAIASEILQSQKVKKSPESFRIGTTNYLRAIALNSSSIQHDVAWALGRMAGTLAGEPPIEQYNLLVLKCMRACAGKKK